MKRALFMLLMLATPLWAVQPDEILDDPVLEQRARDLSMGLRCLVCRNENIDESNADLARDLRLIVRERLTAGDTNDEVISYLVNRYGEYVLLNPRASGSSMILWLAGPAMLLAALSIAGVYLRRRRPDTAPTELSDAEKLHLSQLIDD